MLKFLLQNLKEKEKVLEKLARLKVFSSGGIWRRGFVQRTLSILIITNFVMAILSWYVSTKIAYIAWMQMQQACKPWSYASSQQPRTTQNFLEKKANKSEWDPSPSKTGFTFLHIAVTRFDDIKVLACRILMWQDSALQCRINLVQFAFSWH